MNLSNVTPTNLVSNQNHSLSSNTGSSNGHLFEKLSLSDLPKNVSQQILDLPSQSSNSSSVSKPQTADLELSEILKTLETPFFLNQSISDLRSTLSKLLTRDQDKERIFVPLNQARAKIIQYYSNPLVYEADKLKIMPMEMDELMVEEFNLAGYFYSHMLDSLFYEFDIKGKAESFAPFVVLELCLRQNLETKTLELLNALIQAKVIKIDKILEFKDNCLFFKINGEDKNLADTIHYFISDYSEKTINIFYNKLEKYAKKIQERTNLPVVDWASNPPAQSC